MNKQLRDECEVNFVLSFCKFGKFLGWEWRKVIFKKYFEVFKYFFYFEFLTFLSF